MGDTRKPIGRLEVKSYRFESSFADARVSAEWGMLTVPENRRRPDTGAIELSFVRFPATTSRPGHPVLFLAGGPGQSGVEFARGSHFPLFMSLREVGDVIALDQRGTGSSRPRLLCGSDGFRMPPDRPAVREQALDLAIRGGRSCASNLRSKGIDPAGYNTVESADDIDDLRRALGAEKFHLWGISYGTHLAFAVLKRHPGGVGRCVLGGAEGPDHTFKLPSIVQSQLERIGGLCSGHPAWNGVLPDLVSTVRGVLDGLEQIPVTIEVPDPRTGRSTRVGLGRFDVEYATAVGMADTRLLSLLPAWYAGMEKGDFTLPEREPVLAKYMALVKRGVGFNAMGVLMDCASGATAQRWERIEREAPRCALGRTIDFPFPEIGEAWGRPDLGDDYRALVHADNAVLFFSGSLDCRTPLENILEVRKGLPNSGTIVVDGAGHMDVFLSCPDTAGVMTRFLSGEDVDLRKRPAIRPFALADPLP